MGFRHRALREAGHLSLLEANRYGHGNRSALGLKREEVPGSQWELNSAQSPCSKGEETVEPLEPNCPSSISSYVT